jgi:hypothetical protein
VVRDLTFRHHSDLQGSKVIAAVRGTEQVKALAKAGIDVVQLDLGDADAVEKCVLDNKSSLAGWPQESLQADHATVDIVVHTASSAIPEHPISFMKALAQRRQITGQQVYYIHSGITALFTEQTGWPYGHVEDTDADILSKEKEIGAANPVRATDITVVDEAKANGVQAFNMVIPMTYGVGDGEWKKVSQNIPAQLRASLKNKLVRKFEEDAASPATHVSDLTALYALLVSKLVAGIPVPHNERGYLFAFAHRAPWHKTMDRLAEALYKRGLVSTPNTAIWPSYEAAAEQLGWPPQLARAMATTAGDLVAVQAYKELGWQPVWTEQMYLDSMDEEIDGVLEHDKFEPTLYNALR